MDWTRVPVKTGKPYEVRIGPGLLDACGGLIASLTDGNYERVAVITDSTVGELFGARVVDSLRREGYEAHRFSFPAGEGSKTMDTCMQIVGYLIDHGFTRTDLVLALGGGVVGDLTGFAASICLRGIDFIQLPTTLLAAVDSSVGGKTAVNVPQGKNLVGAFYQPRLVLCDTEVIRALPDEIFADGMAEVIKTAIIRDAALFPLLVPGVCEERLEEIIARCVEIKAGVVAQDERDHDLRNILNFGHTLGHAVEKLSGFTVSHGRAVSIGMCLIAAAGERAGITQSGSGLQIAAQLKRWKLPTATDYSAGQLADACSGDKKSSGSGIRLVLLEEIGKVRLHRIETAALRGFLEGGA